MEVGFQRGHVLVEKTTILANAVAADRRLALGHPLLEEGDGLRFGRRRVDLAFTYALGQAALAMGAGVPLVHSGQRFVALVNGDHRAFGQHVQLAVGDDGGHLDDHVALRLQASHFQVDPDQVIGVLHG